MQDDHTEAERAKFEAWAATDVTPERDSFGDYADRTVRNLWQGWLARATLASAPAPQALEVSSVGSAASSVGSAPADLLEEATLLGGWKLNHVQFVRGTGKAEIGYLDPEDDRFSPIVTVDTGLYYRPEDAAPLATAILAHLRAPAVVSQQLTTEAAGDKPSPVEAAGAAPPEMPPMPQYWSVSVGLDGDTLVSIGPGWVSGIRQLGELDEQTIVGAARHLLSFVGYGLPPCSFNPDEALAAPPAQQWLPIETAPKGRLGEGSHAIILGFAPDDEGYSPGSIEGAWNHHLGRWSSTLDPGWESSPQPTHWMPLPPAPQHQGGGNAL